MPQPGQASPLPVWDPLLRLTHWAIALVVLGNYALTKEGGAVHIALGWAGLALLVLRLIWGFVGPAEARFTSFPPNPMAALRHLAGLLRGKAAHYPSHNPAGAMMAYALWLCLAVLIGSGLWMTGGRTPMAQANQEAAVAAGDWAALVEEDGEEGENTGESPLGEVLEEVHEVAANLILLLAFLHVAGVALESRVMGRNLVRPMVISRRGRT
ncbi:MAG: cytochrome B [Pseudorhodobacter sp.]|nr:MAG: cytochrome B [Pseudorhodobacter sp.]